MSMGAGATAGAGNFPAKYSFAGSALCSDWVAFNTSLASSATQASIVAYTNLYKTTCGSATTPQTIRFAYDTSGGLTGPVVKSSIVLSGDGSQIAFVQTTATPTSYLVLLKIGATNDGATAGIPWAPTTVANAAYKTCAAPCMTMLQFNNTAGNATDVDDSWSSPFYDYVGDIIYVGDDKGVMHKFANAFLGAATPTQTQWAVITSGTQFKLTSPVYDSVSGKLFVAGSNGYLYSMNVTGSTVTQSALIAPPTGGIADNESTTSTPLLVDSTAGTVYVFEADDVGGCGGQGCARVFQFSTGFAAGNAGTSVTVGRGNYLRPGRFLYPGDFDNAYYTNGTATPSGHLLVCGVGTPNNGVTPTIFRINIVNGVMSSVTQGPSLTNADANCSPITEVYDGTNDNFYMSVSTGSNVGGSNCAVGSACLYAFQNIGITINTGTAPSASFQVTGGTSGIVMDNTAVATTGAAQIYFTHLGDTPCAGNGTTGGTPNSGCATQVSQSNLQ